MIITEPFHPNQTRHSKMPTHRSIPPMLALFLLCLIPCTTTVATSFLFNEFNPSDLLLYGHAYLDSTRILSLTNDSQFTTGRALYPTKIPTKEPSSSSSRALPFSASFIFSMAPYPNVLPGHGIVFLFLFAPFAGINESNSGENLGFWNRTNNGKAENHVFGVEFDVLKNQEFNDIDDNHVGVDLGKRQWWVYV